MLDIQKLLIKILEALKADYVVERGTSGDWTYTKWNSGKLEQVCRNNPGSYAVNTARGSLYSGNWKDYAFPIAFVGNYPTVISSATLGTDYYIVGSQQKNLTLTSISIRITSTGSISASSYFDISIYACGRWK